MCQAIAGKLIQVHGHQGVVQYMGPEGLEQHVSLMFVPQAQVGDYLLVHVGLPLHIITYEEALYREELRRKIIRMINADRGNETDYLRSEGPIQVLLDAIRHVATREYTIMEVCGGQTEVIDLYNFRTLLAGSVRFADGPGCPVCVTPANMIDAAIDLACRTNVVLAAFGDIMRTPGSYGMSLARARAERNASIYEVDSPDAALFYARQHPDIEVVYFAIGFETTSAPNALTLYEAMSENVQNFSMLVTQVMVPPALHMLLTTPGFHVDGFLGAGHVCAIMGYHEYHSIAEQYKIPIVITGFEPVDFLLGVYQCVEMLEAGRYGVENAYPRMVTEQGNIQAQDYMRRMFYHEHCEWNGFGIVPYSGLHIRPKYRMYDALHRFGVHVRTSIPDPRCKLREIYTNQCTPRHCPEFCTSCTPETPIGAGMLGEGPCKSAYITL
jgi:hydrogenase expression/formation protein HypD